MVKRMIKNSGFNYQQWLKNVDLIIKPWDLTWKSNRLKDRDSIIKSWDLTIKTGMILPQHAVN